jgi:hypothetical protein
MNRTRIPIAVGTDLTDFHIYIIRDYQCNPCHPRSNKIVHLYCFIYVEENPAIIKHL